MKNDVRQPKKIKALKSKNKSNQRVSTSEILELLLFKKHERSECIIHAFAFGVHKYFQLKTAPTKRVQRASIEYELQRVPRAVLLPFSPFYSFKKLLKAFSPPSKPCCARLSDFKKLLLSDIKLLLADKTSLKNYFWRTLKLLLSDIKLHKHNCSLMLKNYKNRSHKISRSI